jgi:glutamine synthetase
VHCFVRDPITRDVLATSRGIAKKAELHLTQTGIADTSWGPQCESHSFATIRFDQNQYEGYYQIDSVAGSPQQSELVTAAVSLRLQPSQD